MYEELVKRLREVEEMLKIAQFNEADSLISEAAEAIEELSVIVRAQKAVLDKFPKWIPVTERLPECERGTEVGNIEWISCGMVFAGCFGRSGKYRDAYFRTWTNATEGMDARDADYWRLCQIPDPPKEGK